MHTLRTIGWNGILCGIALLTACSDDESTIRQPETQNSNTICQIRIEHNDGIRLLDFTYDEWQRVSQQIETRAEGSDLATAIYRYTYPSGRIEIEQSNGKRLGLALNGEGYVAQVESSDGTLTAYTYNSNGFYYEKPSDAAWDNYEYLLSGSRCNLARITRYGAKNAIGTAAELAEVRFTPGELSNDANLNLAYLITRDVQSERLRESDAMLFGWAGRCESNLPTEYRYEEMQTGAVVTCTFTYTMDTTGRIAQIDARQADSNEVTSYKISYYK